MDYEKKYKEALELARVAAFNGHQNLMEGIFPELCESEDEKIRKFLIKWIQDNYYHGTTEIPTKTLIAWLEKQGSEPNWCHHKVDLSNCSEEYRKAYYDGWNNCNQQHSQCKSDGNDVVKCLINGMKFYYEYNEEATWGTEKLSMKVKDILSWLEKQRGEMPADKVKPKFKVGNWVVCGKLVTQITSIEDDGYTNSDQGFISFETAKKFHLWAIQDAKDGDVLVDEDNNIGIYKGIEYIWWKSYIYLGCNNCLYGFNIGGSHKQNSTKPATKEQRDLLFKKMKDAGYEWDAEKKGLRKIEQEPALSEEDEKMCESVIDVLVNNTMSGSEGDKVYSEEIDWLKSLKQRYTWKPNLAQLNALSIVSKGNAPDDIEAIVSLYNDLKKL